MAIIKYNKPKIYRISVPGREKINPSTMIKLVPGTNHVPDEVWQKMINHPHIKQKLDAEEIEVISEGVESLSELSASKAKDLVRETYDFHLLKKWQQDEKRKPVLDAVAAQINKLTTSDKVAVGKSEEAYEK